MEETIYFLSEKEKNAFIDAITPELPLLRAKAGISQEELANLIGISRQTYGAIERCAKKMSWNTYLSLLLFFDYNKKTHTIIRNMPAFPHELLTRFNSSYKSSSFEVDGLLGKDAANIVASLDERALSTIKTLIMVEYSRCSNMSKGSVIRMFEGFELTTKKTTDGQKEIAEALKNIKRNRL